MDEHRMEQPVSDRLTKRCAAGVVLATFLFVGYFWRFLPYGQRERNSPTWWTFPSIMLIVGFLLTLRIERRRFWVCNCLLLTLFAANAILIVVDCASDPTNHNLFPFEFMMIALFTLPAYLGASIAAAVDRYRSLRNRA